MEIVNLLNNQPQIRQLQQFIADCQGARFRIQLHEPCYNDHPGPVAERSGFLTSIPIKRAGRRKKFIANTYNAIRSNAALWDSTVC